MHMNQSDLEYFVTNSEAGRHVCPVCSPERKKKNEKTLNIQPDGGCLLYRCWHCEVSGKVTREVSPFDGFPPETATVKAISKPKASDKGLVTAFLIERGIDPETIGGYNVVGGTKYFHNGGEMDAIGFVYGDNEAIKWRAVTDKQFTQDGSAQTLWGIETAPSDGLKTIIITEGEFDALAIASAIGDCPDTLVVSVPNGAPQKVSNKRVDAAEDRKFAYLWAAKDVFEQAEKIILAVDSDEPGQVELNATT
jgi:hypothetical protein